MLSFNHVDFAFPNQPLFNDLNLDIAPGDFAFLIGKSGAGKTTLLQMIYMNLIPSAGTVRFLDYTSDTITPAMLPQLRRKLGIIFQDYKLLEDRNIFDNVAFVLKVTGTAPKTIKRKVVYALSEVGLAHKQNNYPSELSGGEKQRIAIARAIINEPSLILADEPTGNLDPQTAEEILGILKKVNSKGTSVIFATHNYELVKRHEAKIIRIDDGKAYKVVLKKKSGDN
jgi:cell division transport system ATP-binding protein